MSLDRLLATVLGQYQTVHDAPQTEHILASTTTLLTSLSNPLNLTLLTSQLLTAPAIWRRPPEDGLRTPLRVISIYRTAAIHVRRNEMELHSSRRRGPGLQTGSGLGGDAWARAIAKGADGRSSRWQHLLVLTGMLMGLGVEGEGLAPLSRGMRGTLEEAVVMAANLAMETESLAPEGPIAGAGVVLALNYAFPVLSEHSRASVNSDTFLGIGIGTLVGTEGFQDGAFIDAIGADVAQSHDRRLSWPPNVPSFLLLRQLEQKPLLQGLGPLSRLLAWAVENARDSGRVLEALEVLVGFTGQILRAWQATKFSELEVSDEAVVLSTETMQQTWPVLWQLLKKLMYAVVAILQPIVARSLLDRHLRSDGVAPAVAARVLHILRNIYFISSRDGNSAFQVYEFTYLTSIDIIARHPAPCMAFLREITPKSSGRVPDHALHRVLDLFYLNTAEHLPLNLPPDACDSLIVQPATTYLTHPVTHSAPLSLQMVELFEAAHSAVLAVMACPHNAPLTARLAPSYAETLLVSFPSRISARQFRLAFKTTMQIVSPPFPLSASHPDLAETLLEMVHFRALAAETGTAPLRPGPGEAGPPVSEQSALALTLVDALPFLPLAIVEGWMAVAAETLNRVADPAMREAVRRRFWDVLVSGEMDVERAAIGVAWWGTKGGRDLVLYGAPGMSGQQVLMSGAILDQAGESRL